MGGGRVCLCWFVRCCLLVVFRFAVFAVVCDCVFVCLFSYDVLFCFGLLVVVVGVVCCLCLF